MEVSYPSDRREQLHQKRWLRLWDQNNYVECPVKKGEEKPVLEGHQIYKYKFKTPSYYKAPFDYLPTKLQYISFLISSNASH